SSPSLLATRLGDRCWGSGLVEGTSPRWLVRLSVLHGHLGLDVPAGALHAEVVLHVGIRDVEHLDGRAERRGVAAYEVGDAGRRHEVPRDHLLVADVPKALPAAEEFVYVAQSATKRELVSGCERPRVTQSK